MTDLLITITDENGDVFKELEIYCDGSDSEDAEKIERILKDHFRSVEDVS